LLAVEYALFFMGLALFTDVPGLTVLTVLAALSEIGPDLVKTVLGTMFLFRLG
ncbi:hypothetical protein Tco_0587319, partial [Tanacetum coccineum]